MNQEIRGAIQWLKDEGYNVILADEAIATNDLPSWSRTAIDVGSKLTLWCVKPHSTVTLPFGLTKSMVQRGGELQVNRKRLQHALNAYQDNHGGAIGVKLGSLTGGNTKVVIFVPGDTLTSDMIRRMLCGWVENAAVFQAIGHSPGQVYGEFAIGLWMLGAGGFRFQQPVEVYPQFIYLDSRTFSRHVNDLLAESLLERFPKVRHAGDYMFKKAPAFLQASFLYAPAGEMATLKDRHETRTRWLMYKKPKLAPGVFNAKSRERLLRHIRQCAA
jgi:hypothetical protein